MDAATYDQIHVSPRSPSATPRTSCSRTRTPIVALHEGDAALRRAARLRRPRDHLHRAGPAGRPLDRRHQAGDPRDRLRDPGAAVPRDRQQGQGRHPRRATTSAASADPSAQMAARTKARKRALDVLFEAEQRGLDPLHAARRAARAHGRPAASRRTPRSSSSGVVAHRERIDELIATYAAELDARADARRSTARSCGSAPTSCSSTTTCRTRVAISEAVELARQLSTDDSPGVRQRPAGPAARAEADPDASDAGPPGNARETAATAHAAWRPPVGSRRGKRSVVGVQPTPEWTSAVAPVNAG